MDHMPFLIERALEPGGDPCGHALMATCPPDAFLNYDGPMSPDRALEIPFGNSVGALKNGQKTWDLDSAGLANLLDLSKRLDLDGEITPVMAFGMMLAHPRFSEFTMSDFAKVTEDLSAKVRCYGYVCSFLRQSTNSDMLIVSVLCSRNLRSKTLSRAAFTPSPD